MAETSKPHRGDKQVDDTAHAKPPRRKQPGGREGTEGRDKVPQDTVKKGKRSPNDPWMGGG